jgi:molecular chaperone GrpE
LDSDRGGLDAADPGTMAADGVPADRARAQLDLICAGVQDLADSARRYHARAEQREAVIDHLRAEVDRLRRGERRGLLRPLLVEVCRLRDDLLRSAGDLPADFNAERASRLLLSYAESVALALENNGVVAYEAEPGTEFDPRRHRRAGSEGTAEPALAGRIASTRRSGYLDVDAGAPISPAEVAVFTVTVSSGPVAPEPTSTQPPAQMSERDSSE